MGRKLALGLLLLIFGPTAFADVLLSYPKIAGVETRYVEVGSSPKITVRYKNNFSYDVFVSAAEIYLKYKAVIDTIVGIKNENPGNLHERGMDISTPGEIFYKLEASPANWKPIKVTPGETIDLATITFHISQTASSGWVNLFVWSATPSRVFQKTTDITGSLVPLVSISLQPSKPPSFSGLNSVDSKDALGRTNVGTVLLDWRTAGPGARDLTPYNNSKLNYRVFRSTDPGFRSDVTELTTPPTLSPDEDPEARPLPYTGNIEGTDCIYEDRDATIGTAYYYKVTASDACSPTPNEIDTPIKGPVIPLDLTPPAEVKNLTALAGDNKVTLRWEYPTPVDPDLDGVVIVKNEGRDVGAGSLGLAQSIPPYGPGREYFYGDEPFGSGNGRIIFISAPGENPTEFEDFEALNGTLNYYKVFTYDRLRNYSKGVTVKKTAGVPPQPITNFTVYRGLTPDEIIFSWNNSESDFAAGTFIRVSSDDRYRFGALRTPELGGDILGAFPVTSGPGGLEETTMTFLSGRTYYFKAWAYNLPDFDPANPETFARTQFSEGVTAAVTLPQEALEEIFVYTYEFQPGINHFAVPFSERVSDFAGRLIDISTWAKLVDELNRQAGENVVLTFGRWNNVLQKAEGIIKVDYSKTGRERFVTTSGLTPDEPVIQGGAYEISVSKPFTFTLRHVRTLR